MRILYIFDTRTKPLVEVFLMNRTGLMFNVDKHVFPRFKLLGTAPMHDVIHVYDLPELGAWVKKMTGKPTILHYTKDIISKIPLYKRQPFEKRFDRIVVNTPDLLEEGYHTTPVCLDVDLDNLEITNDELEAGIIKLKRIYNELWRA